MARVKKRPQIKETDVRSTPQAFYDELNKKYSFGLDAAADASNAKCPRYYGPGGEVEDALSVDWPTDIVIWLNPPYSTGNQPLFVKKAIETAERGGRVIALLPADTSTRMFHELIWGKFPVEFTKRRLKFQNSKAGAKFGSMVVDFVYPGIRMVLCQEAA